MRPDLRPGGRCGRRGQAILLAWLAAAPALAGSPRAAPAAAAPATAAPGDCVHRPAPAWASGAAAGRRVAMVVGEGAYAGGLPALPNPAHDAAATEKALAALGFEVFAVTDADAAGLQRCADATAASLSDADVALFYYSGHGIQVGDANYLVATDADARNLEKGLVPVQPIVDALQRRAKATLVLLDACRTNPLAEGRPAGLSVSTGRGLARVPEAGVPAPAPAAVQARGLMVAYATSPNAVAADGTGELSPFTGAFVRLIGTSGYSVQRVMGEVTKSVGEATDYAQTPWMKSSLTEELKLGGADTLADARSMSDNHAARALTLLKTQGRREAAVVEALKGLPPSPDAAALERFPRAYLALYSAMQSRDVTLPIAPGHAQVAVSTRDRVAVFTQQGGVTSGHLDLWSAGDARLVATLPVAELYRVAFSPHGRLLASQSSRGGVTVFDGQDGTKLFELRGGSVGTGLAFSPDESRLMVVGDALQFVDAGTGKLALVVKAGQLAAGPAGAGGAGRRRSGSLVQAVYAGDDKVCFILSSGIGGGLVGVYDLKENRTTRLRETDAAVSVMACDPAGRYLVRSFAVGAGQQGMEVWDLAADRVATVAAPIVNLMGMDPKGGYVSALAFLDSADGLYDLTAAAKGHPSTVPDGFSVEGSRLFGSNGALINEDLTPNPWRDWPDEGLFGPALVEKAAAGLTAAQRDEVARDRIAFSAAADPAAPRP